MKKPVLIIVHQENSTPGRVGRALRSRGYSLDIRRPRFGDPLPATLEDFAAAVIFGGPMSANDPDDFVKREIDWINVPLREDVPFLGICLGAQMMAKTLGGAVAPNHRGEAEIGYYTLEPTQAGQTMMDWPAYVYQWHREGFECPVGTTHLATGELYDNQAMRVGRNAYGIQFHPELTLAMMNRWTVLGAERLNLPGAQPRAAHFKGRGLYDCRIQTWLNDFLDLWLNPVEANAESLWDRNGALNVEAPRRLAAG